MIRSGGNAPHGSVYEFLRNDKLDARNFFDAQRKPPFRQNQFGANAGGPIRRDSYDGLRVRQSLTQTFSVPPAAVRGGDFSGAPPIYDPLTTQAAGARSPFLGNQIPVSRLDRAAGVFLQKLATPNLQSPVQNLLATPSLQNTADQGIVRLDHQLTPRDSVFLRL
ncbi:MAG TPA: hypothetical protein VIO38_17205, partial [Rariglobus sp.]